jgi:phosphatidylglycerophosphate synthase
MEASEPLTESFEQFRTICQPRQEPTVSSRLIRRVSIYLTWFLVKTPLTANQVSVLFLLVGVAGAALLGTGDPAWTVLGVLLLQLHILLDYSDGEVARYREATSKLGSFLDINFHLVIHAAIFAGITQAVFYHYWSSPLALWLGASAIVFASTNRGLKANVMRILAEEGDGASVPEVYEGAAGSVRRWSRLLNTAQDLVFGYRSFVFVILFGAALLNRLDWVLVFYGTVFPVFYTVKAALLWRGLAR